jgi:hypothetical protein
MLRAMRHIRTTALMSLLLLALLDATSISRQSEPSSKENRGQQVSFCPDLSINNPVAVPERVLSVLLRHKDVRDALKSASESERSRPQDLFTAAEIHLSKPSEVDLVVVGKYPLSGADNTWFWIVRQANTTPRIVLWEGANCMDISKCKTRGLSDIWVGWSSAAESRERVYRFNGNKYRLSKQKWSENTP